MKWPPTLLLPLAVLASESDLPVQPFEQDQLDLAISDAAHRGGRAGFYFLPPLVPNPHATGTFDPSLLPLLSVEICEWTGSGCVLPLVARFTSEEGTDGRVIRIKGEDDDDDEDGDDEDDDDDQLHYAVKWKTKKSELDPNADYRIRVLASGVELGHADVDVVKKGKELKNVDTGEFIPLKNGRTLPIKFRVEEGAIAQVGAGGGQTELAGGQVMLDIPAGAVGGPIAVDAVPVTDPSTLPPSPTPIPGTAFDLQPDGTVFAEPIRLTISYDPAMLPPGVPEAELRIHKLVNGEYVQLDAGLVDLANKTVSGLTDEFSIYVLLQRLFPGSPTDATPPQAGMLTVRNPQSGMVGDAAAIDVSASDVTLTFRITGTDNISGIQGFQIRYWIGPGRLAKQVFCDALISGGDTNGEWECDITWPQYSELGAWQVAGVRPFDNLGNLDLYGVSENTLCTPGGDCMTPLIPVVVVSSTPFDMDPPEIVAAGFGFPSDPTPTISNNIAVDVSSGPVDIVLRMHALDDLSGTTAEASANVRSPSLAQGVGCFSFSLVQGTPTDDIWECGTTIPEFSESGLWSYQTLFPRDRVRNINRYVTDGAAQLCPSSGPCVPNATVDVTSIPDLNFPPNSRVHSSANCTAAGSGPRTPGKEPYTSRTSRTTRGIADSGARVSPNLNGGVRKAHVTIDSFSTTATR